MNNNKKILKIKKNKIIIKKKKICLNKKKIKEMTFYRIYQFFRIILRQV